jgi:TatD DNase family protein
MMGLHPGYVDANWKEALAAIEKELFSGSYIAVGEIGMDLYWDKTFVEEQQHVFAQQVMWAKELHLPIAIHARDAFEPIFDILDELNDENLTGVFHCFTGTVEQAQKVLDYGGFYFGIGGVVTYKNAGLDRVVAELPMDKLVLETDAPYLPPVPHRGKRNESAYLLHVAEKVAEVKNLSLKEVAEITTHNAKSLFRLT